MSRRREGVDLRERDDACCEEGASLTRWIFAIEMQGASERRDGWRYDETTSKQE